jgi:hypothetical protein
LIPQHLKLKRWLPSYILHSQFLVLLTAPLIYVGFIPFAFARSLGPFLSRHLLPDPWNIRHRLRAPRSRYRVSSITAMLGNIS